MNTLMFDLNHLLLQRVLLRKRNIFLLLEKKILFLEFPNDGLIFQRQNINLSYYVTVALGRL